MIFLIISLYIYLIDFTLDPPFTLGHTFLLKSEKDHNFLLGHSHGTDWVEYDARGWLSYAKQNPASTNAASLLQDSQK